MLAQEKFHHHFTVNDGLPSNVIYKSTQDEQGFIWICTEKGVAVYDGYTFLPIDNVEQKLNSNDIWETVIDKYKRKWFFTMDADPVITTNGKAYLLNELAPQFKGNLYPWSLNNYTLKYATNNNFILLNKTDDYAYYLDSANQVRKLPLPMNLIRALKNNEVFNFSIEKDLYYALYKSGWMVTYNLSGKKVASDKKYNFGFIREILQEELSNSNNRVVYFKDSTNFYKFENGQIELLSYSPKNEKPFSIVGTSQENIFIKENDILYTLDKKTVSTKVLFTKNVKGARQLYEDKEKNIWIASQEDGIYLLPFHALNTKIYNTTNGLSYPKITAMAFGRDGKLYLGNNYGTTIGVFEKGNFSTIPKVNLKDYFIYVDQLNNIWLSGLNIISDHKITQATSNYRIYDGGIKAIGNRYLNIIGIHPKSICQIGDDIFFGRKMLQRGKLQGSMLYLDSIWDSDYTIYSLEAQENKALFMGTTNGIYVLNIATNTFSKIINDKLTGNIRDIKYHNNQLWVATDKQGLVIYNLTTKKSSMVLALVGKTISDIHYDPIKSNMWLSSNKGLFKIAVQKNIKNKYAIQQFTTSNGLPANEVNCCLTRNNTVYVGTAQGLAIFEDAPPNLTYKPQILHTRFNVNSKDLAIQSAYNLTHDQNHIIIELTALTLSSLGNVTYRYQLQGADDKWSEGKNRTLEYPNLPPGNYTLIAHAFDANGQKTSNEIRIAINIEPPVTKTWWFQTLSILLLIGLIGTFFYWRSKENNKKALLEKQFSNLKLEALQSQLNSHFIFNALNAIQAYIIQKDERQASKYMSQFAKLMRAFLESSRSRTISIQDEIDFIRTYISLEQIIYEDKFDSEIFIDPTLDTSLKIPSNITQPFIENAILHGLMPLKRKGKLNISFTVKNDLVAQCKIIDDGVGYNTEKKNKTIKSKSHGQNIIHERIAILKKDHKLDVDIEIIDRKKQSDEDGTIIIINFKNNGAD